MDLDNAVTSRPSPTRLAARDAAERGRHNLRSHLARPGKTISYELRNHSGEHNNSCTLTWTPGTLTLSGDVAEAVLSHCSALSEFEPGLRWVERGSINYLLEKSNLNDKVLDREATAESLIEDANAEALYAAQARRDERNANRRAESYGDAIWAQDMAWWHLTRNGPAPRLYDYLPEPDWRDAPKPQFVKRDPGPIATRFDVETKWDIPDGWDQWFRIYNRFGMLFDPNQILKSAERRATAEELVSEMTSPDMSADEVAEICTLVCPGDYYGTYVSDPRSVYLVSVLRTAAGLVLDQLEPSRTWGRTWGDPVV